MRSTCVACSLIVNVTSVPMLILDLSDILPPRLSTSFFEIVRPRPVPFELILPRCLLAIPNILKSLGMSLLGMPTPVSDTSNSKYLTLSNELASNFDFEEIWSVIPPCCVNLNALEIKLFRICLMRPTSELNISWSIECSTSTLKYMPFWAHWNSNTYSMSCMSDLILKGCSLRVKVPASILARSRMSSTKLIKLVVDIFQILKNFSFISKMFFGNNLFLTWLVTSLSTSLNEIVIIWL